jgi:hypothetical protein
MEIISIEKLSGNEVYCTNSPLLLVKNMLRSELHCQKGLNVMVRPPVCRHGLKNFLVNFDGKISFFFYRKIPRSMGYGEHGVYGVGVGSAVTPRPCRRQKSG